MRTEERIRAVKRVIDQGEAKLDAPGPSLVMNCHGNRPEEAHAGRGLSPHSAGQGYVRQRPCR